MVQKATIPATEINTLESSHVAQEFRISIALPYSYPEQPERTYPTVYLLDANWYFGMVTETVRIMSLCASLPEVLVVGIGYPADEPLLANFPTLWQCRSREYSPIRDEVSVKSDQEWLKVDFEQGGAANFLRFIHEELLPFIEGAYRATPGDRVLVGHSLGGLFALYALFHQPKLFTKYVAISPSLLFGQGVMFEYERQYAAAHDDLPIELYLGVGLEEEGEFAIVGDLLRLAATLERRGYKDFKLTKRIYEGGEHCGVTAPLFQAGLQAVLEDYPKRALW